MVEFLILSMWLEEVGGLVELVGFLGETFGLELAEQDEGFFELAGEALAMEAESGESLGVAVEGGSDGYCFPHLVRRFMVGEVLVDDVVG